MAVLFGHKDEKVKRSADRMGWTYSHCSLLVVTGDNWTEYEYTGRGVAVTTDVDKLPKWSETYLQLSPNFSIDAALQRLHNYIEWWADGSTLAEMLEARRGRVGSKTCVSFVCGALGLPPVDYVISTDQLLSMLRSRGTLIVLSTDRFLPATRNPMLVDLGTAMGRVAWAAKQSVPSATFDDNLGVRATVQATWSDSTTEGLLVQLPNGVVLPLLTAYVPDPVFSPADVLDDWSADNYSVKDLTDRSLRRISVDLRYLPYAVS